MARLTRRGALATMAPLLAAPALVPLVESGQKATAGTTGPTGPAGPGHGGGHAGGHLVGGGFRGNGRVDPKVNGFDPAEIVRDFDWGRTRRLPSGRVLREWDVVGLDKEIEVAPGIKYPAWTFDGRVPGPTLRAREGELLRINFANGSEHPHTMHFHGIHPAAMDGVPGIGDGLIKPGGRTTYEFEAKPFGLHLYHCHANPLAAHIAHGMYGTFIVDPIGPAAREEADELVMVMNGFDTNFDGENEIYAVNTVGFAYAQDPIRVRQNQLVRVYLVNILEYDLLNSFHIHGNFFDWYPTGTRLQPIDYTDTVMLCQGQRGILELRFPEKGQFMFHAHQSEFAELGWMSFFEVV